MLNSDVVSLAAKLYHEVYPNGNFYNLQITSRSYEGFTRLARKMLEKNCKGSVQG